MPSMKIVVRAPNWIGDAVLSLPALFSLQANFPDAEVWVAARDWVGELFLMSGSFSGLVSVPGKPGLNNLRSSVRVLREPGFHIGLLLTNSFASACLFYLAGIPERWGYNRDGRGLLLTKKVPVAGRERISHQVHYYLSLLSGLGMETPIREPSLSVKETAVQETKEWLRSFGLAPDVPLVLLHPGASYGSAKRWPASRYAQLAVLLQENLGVQVALVGSVEDVLLAEAVTSNSKKPPVVLSGKTDLVKLAAVIRNSAVFITNDSGPMHLANALGTPVIALFGPTDPARTGPFRPPSLVIHKKAACWPCSYRECPFDHRCMMDISPQEVLEACRGFLP